MRLRIGLEEEAVEVSGCKELGSETGQLGLVQPELGLEHELGLGPEHGPGRERGPEPVQPLLAAAEIAVLATCL